MENEKTCMVCRITDGILTSSGCINKCKYFVCKPCNENWIKLNYKMKCFYGCKFLGDDPVRFSDNPIVTFILNKLDVLGDKMTKILFDWPDTWWKVVTWIIMSFFVTAFILVPCMMIISIITIRSDDGWKLFKCVTFPVCALALSFGIALIN